MYKRLLATIFVCLMILSLAACGKKTAINKGTGWLTDGFVFEGISSIEKTVELGKPETQLDPQAIYNKIT